MDRALPGKSLPGTLSLANKGISQSIYRIVDCSDPGIIRDVWNRNVCERTSNTANRRDTESPAARTPNVNCDYAWQFGRINEFDPLPQPNERECEKILYETIH